MQRRTIGILTVLIHLVYAIPQEKAVVPTAAGQIGVNPVDFIPSSAPTEFFTQDQTTTRWIGVNTVNVETITITNGATIVTTTEPAPVAMITASAAGGDGTEVGDISFIVSPDAEAQLRPIFDAATAACSAAKKIKTRDLDSCLLDFFSSNVDSAIFGNLTEVGSTALKAYDADEGNPATLAVLGTGVVSIGTVFLYISYGKFMLSDDIPEIVKISSAEIDPSKSITPSSTTTQPTTTLSSSSSSSSSTIPLPFFTGLTHMDGGTFDTGVSGVMATVLEARWDSIAAAPSLTTSIDCTCTQLVSPQGSNLNLQCPTAQDGSPAENCDLVTSTMAPSTTSIPTLTPVPNPATNIVCNTARPANAPAPSFIPTGQTFNRIAASEAIPNFCKSFPYVPQDGANCATWQSFPFDGTTLLGNDGGQTGIGPIERIYMATRWDTGECPINQWWINGDPELTPAAVYLNSTGYYNDCVAGFTATLGACDGKNANTDGGRASYNCLEYLLFPSSSSNLQIDCKASGGLAAW